MNINNKGGKYQYVSIIFMNTLFLEGYI